MKKILALCIIFVGSFFFFSKIHTSEKAQQVVSKVLPITSQSHTNLTPLVDLPETISIPAIGITAPIEETGTDTQGRMGIPQNDTDTAWYKDGYRPGEKGSAVIDGHFDTVTGAPAVFYNISQLKSGDKIIVTDVHTHIYSFTVTQVVSYPFDQLPMQQIFASTDTGRLNLITCDGTWSRSAHNYSNRVVVYSVLHTK